MNKTNISYLDYTWNPTKGCSKISAGCTHCWAEKMSKRQLGMGSRGYEAPNPFKPTFCEWKLKEPFKVKKPSIIGTSFMGDLFHNDITYGDKLKIFDEMTIGASRHTYVLCTKRPENIIKFLTEFPTDIELGCMDNIWFGCSIEDNKVLQERLFQMALLKNSFGLNTWLSIEPLLEDISKNLGILLKHAGHDIIDGIIVGGESGTGARFCNPNWITNVINICPEKSYFKQWGTNKENSNVPVSLSEGFNLFEVKSIKNLPWIK